MKSGLLLFFVFAVTHVSAAAPDRASQFVDGVIKRGQQILELKDESDRTLQMCALMRENLASVSISKVWLGQYFDLQRDQVAVQEFTYMVPSILITKAVPILGTGSANGTVVVDEQSKLRSPGILEVGVTVTTNNRVHKGIAVVHEGADGKVSLLDVEYNNYSAVGYQAREYQNFLNRQYNKDPENSLPVTALVKHVTSQEDYIDCP